MICPNCKWHTIPDQSEQHVCNMCMDIDGPGKPVPSSIMVGRVLIGIVIFWTCVAGSYILGSV